MELNTFTFLVQQFHRTQPPWNTRYRDVERVVILNLAYKIRVRRVKH